MDQQRQLFAEKLVNYCCSVQKGEHVLIKVTDEDAFPLVRKIIKEVYKVGAHPHVQLENSSITRELLLGCTKEQLELNYRVELERVKAMDACIYIRGFSNAFELADVPEDRMKLFTQMGREVQQARLENTKWVGLRYPNYAIAQLAQMSLESYERFHYKVCNMDYAKMSEDMEHLVELMERTDRVRIVAKDTDLTFSIKGIPAIKCDGKVNIPDGEVFTAPIRDSVNGYISFNLPSLYQGFTFDNIYFEFNNGKITKATCNDTKRLNDILDIDEGARYLGEFSFGVNPYITQPMNDGGIDEKIAGSIHITPGSCYEEAPNGNDSKIHWDLVLMQTPEFGGGEIYFDDILIRKDGLFVLEELKCLNP
jgi:aminopeptidase